MGGDTAFARMVGAAQRATSSAISEAVTPADWDEAVAAWDAVLDRMAQVGAAPDIQAVLFDAAAGARLRRSRCGGPAVGADAAAAAELYRRATDLAAADSPDRRAYLNNLGVALRVLWECEHEPGTLDDAVCVHEAAVAASARDTPDGVTSRVQLGAALRERYQLRHREPDLDAAVATLRAAVEGAAAIAAPELAEGHEALGNALYDSYDATGEPATLEESICNLRAALELTADDDIDRAGYASNLASAFLGRFHLRGDRDDLDSAIGLLEDAFAHAEARDGASAELLANLGNVLSTRAVLAAVPDDAERAVGYLRRAVDRAAGTARQPAMQSNLAAALLDRFDVTGAIADVDDAVELLRAAVATSPVGDPDRASRLNNLAIALRLRQLRRRSGREDLDQAIAAYEAALAETPAAGPERPAFHANLGTALHQRYDVTNDDRDLDRAARELETALARTPADSPDRPMYLNNLSATLAARAERPDNTEDLVRAATMLREGLPLCAESSVHRPGMLVNLGNAASELFDRLGDPKDRADARAAYRSALRAGLVTSPADALAAASNWTEWAARRRAWAEVVQAHRLGQRAALRLFRTQVTRADKESWLRDADGLATYGAFARAVRADLPGAVMAVELGRGLLFSERLERERAGLRRLRAEHEELARRYRAAAARVDQLEGGT